MIDGVALGEGGTEGGREAFLTVERSIVLWALTTDRSQRRE
jgi:hypothetical protein